MAWPVSPSNGQQVTINGTIYQYDSGNSVWNRVFTTVNSSLINVATTVTQSAQPNITSFGSLTNVTMQSNAVLSLTGATSAITGSNLVSANYFTGTLTTGAQPNITSVGILANLSSSGNITAGNLIGPHANGNSNISIAANANITTFVTGNTTSQLTIYNGGINVAGTANILGNANVGNLGFGSGVITGTGNISSGNANLGNLATASYYAGTLTTNAQPNITSVGTLNGLTVLGTTNITGANVVSANYFTGTLTTQAQPNITSVGTLVSLNVTGNITSGGNVIVTANVSSGNANLGNLATASYFTGTLTTNAQPNITSVGILVNLSSTGNVIAGNLIGTHANGNSNISIAANANITTFITGNTTSQLTIANGGVNIAGYANIVGNANIGNATVTGNANVGNLGFGSGVITGTGNISSGNANLGNLVTASYYAGVLTTNAQPNITSVGTLNGLTIAGTLTVTGTTEYVNSTTVYIEDPIVQQGGGANGAALTSNDGYDRGLQLHYYTTKTVDAFMGWKNSAGEFVFSDNASVSGNTATINTYGNIHSGNANLGNLVTANYHAGVLTTGAQPNITSVGTLTSLNVTGNITSGNNVIVTANVSSGNANLGNLATASYFTGTLTTQAQPNITSVSTSFSGLTFATNGNITMSGTGSQFTGANLVSASYFSGNGASLSGINASNIASGTIPSSILGNSTHYIGTTSIALNRASGSQSLTGITSIDGYANTVSYATQSNITAVGTLASLSVTGVVKTPNIQDSSGTNAISTYYNSHAGDVGITGNLTVGTGSSGNLTIANALTVNGNAFHNGFAGFYSSQDRFTVLTGATGVVNHDMSQGALFYHTSPSANFTPNFTNVAALYSNVITVASLIIVQGSTAYMPLADTSNIQIGGSNVTVHWVNGAAPTGYASVTQLVSYSLINNNGTYSVLAQSSFYQ